MYVIVVQKKKSCEECQERFLDDEEMFQQDKRLCKICRGN